MSILIIDQSAEYILNSWANHLWNNASSGVWGLVSLRHKRKYWKLFTLVKRLWLRGKASVLLSAGHWFESPDLHVKVSLGKILNLKPSPYVLVSTLHGSHRHQCMNYCKSRWTKASYKCNWSEGIFGDDGDLHDKSTIKILLIIFCGSANQLTAEACCISCISSLSNQPLKHNLPLLRTWSVPGPLA